MRPTGRLLVIEMLTIPLAHDKRRLSILRRWPLVTYGWGGGESLSSDKLVGKAPHQHPNERWSASGILNQEGRSHAGSESHLMSLPGSLEGLKTALGLIPLIRGLVPAPKATVHPIFPLSNGNPIVILVNGTVWLTRPSWTQDDSHLVDNIGKTIPGVGVLRFDWCGRNSTPSRLDAADGLKEEITRIQREFPTSAIIVVAHSHGGNVLCWASSIIDKRIHGALYINTPFIHFQHIPSGSNWRLRLALFLGPLLLGALAIDHSRRLGIAGHELLFLLMILVTAVLANMTVPRYVTRQRDKLKRLCGDTRMTFADHIFHVVGDEPNAAFGFVYFTRFAGFKLWLILACLFAGTSLIWWLSHKGRLTDSPYQDIFSRIVLIGTLAVAFITACAYGLVHLLLSIDAPTGVSSAPHGTTNVHTIRTSNTQLLHHSMDLREVVQAVTQKIAELV
jgi:hypothetical protein